MANRITYLDGLRGLAAGQVVLEHYIQAFSPGDKSLVGFMADGGVAVHLFFLMSGLVLTHSFERTPHALTAGFARRCIRLGLPLTASIIVASALQAWFPDWKAIAAAQSGSTWFALSRWNDQVSDVFDASGASMLLGYSETTVFGALKTYLPSMSTTSLNAPAWSLHTELWGSVLVLFLVWAKAKSARAYCLMLAASIVLIAGNPLILFVLGHLSSSVIRLTETRSWRKSLAVSASAAALLGIGIIIGEHGDVAPFSAFQDFVMSSGLLHPYVWLEWNKLVSAILIYFAIVFLPALQAILSMRLPAWLGKISFSAYLIHWPIMMSFGSVAFVTASPLGNRAAAAIALIVGIAITAVVSVLFERLVDRPSVTLSRMLRPARRGKGYRFATAASRPLASESVVK